MNFLNLGCGNRFLPGWTNVDFVAQSENVTSHNIAEGLPFQDNIFDMVYHSHLLEHFSKSTSSFFMEECYRVLKRGGVLRVVTPDLEKLVRIYLDILSKVETTGNNVSQLDYQWILLHLLDQAVRNKPGGEMKDYILIDHVENKEFVESLLGAEYENIRNRARKTSTEKLKTVYTNEGLLTTIKIISKTILNKNHPREIMLKALLGKDYETLQVGRFRKSGEVHQWIYDGYSLGCLFKECGFFDIRQYPADKSSISEWNQYFLDTEPDGSVYRPDSIFMEGIKPQSTSNR